MSSPRILVVDDEPDLRELLEITLVKMGLDVDSADSLAGARRHLAGDDYALVLTDMRLPDGLGIDLVREVAAERKHTPIAVLTAFGSADNAVAALKAGAFDYLSKPVGLDQLRTMVQSALRISRPDAVSLTEADAQSQTALRLLGRSAAMQELRAQIVRLARSMAPIAISGESGSGKELAARDIHAQSARADKPFVAVNCGAIPETLMEAEFFGYRKGAFTGATEERDGFFQAANGGTLMLDEVADLPLAMQVKLLRAIQERRVRKIGATAEELVDVRLISATHQELAACVERGVFRQDLYYRLNVIELRLPPLRERSDDIGLLAEQILRRLCTDRPATLAPEALQALQAYAFPGNVRELENILERAVAFANNGVIQVDDLALKGVAPVQPAPPAQAVAELPESAKMEAAALAAAPAQTAPAAMIGLPGLPCSLPDHLDQVEREIIRCALAKTHFNRTQAADLLGISFRQLRYRMQRLDIHEPET
ncbi:MAG: sigma-54-dependent Fis family transcriptional regulator [Burkholderiaceae bacterium]|nr:sigma-54-dependent Fis family transcriptional regulator [Burkholderiaceae bacterium]